MYRPKEIRERLGVSETTLRRWSAAFAPYLSPTAGAAIAESGGPAQRRFTEADLALLAEIQLALARGAGIAEIQARLDVDLPPAGIHADVTSTPPRPAAASPTASFAAGRELVPIVETVRLLAQAEQARGASVEAAAAALTEAAAALRELAAAARREREAPDGFLARLRWLFTGRR